MIQRIQTVFLGLVALCSVALYYTSGDVVLFRTTGVMAFMSGLVFSFSVVSIFSYRNRKKQLLFNNVNLVINVLLIALLTYWLQTLSGGISFPEKGIEPVFPAVAVFCLIMANINIRRDERLVKSVDRLR
ncbi:DUF4293 domain-containing protein [Bergeyella sp. RCAD1439]|uniref:DUF4293 domain-containing protein n=1 Tax=Bergeyella anatis TaxID=3113737 RepID=UPI002E16F52C|nr:DUF4293 domain-containing protein [Bergeyella sp. RCAD1439]